MEAKAEQVQCAITVQNSGNSAGTQDNCSETQDNAQEAVFQQPVRAGYESYCSRVTDCRRMKELL
ncbi:MAG: hypothetical protein ABSC48_05155 [Terracidiphilus sp.]|jgi:hypothetical protein